MIDHEWDAELTGELRDDLQRLLTAAAREDAEAGFPSFALDDEVPEGTRYLLIRLLPDERSGRDEPPPTLAGCLRLEPSPTSADLAEVRLVIDPELRSRGISTSLCEQVGLDTARDGGWAGTGYPRLHCWARGDHPAARRMALRFSHTGLRRARRRWRLLAPLRASAPTDTAADSTSARVRGAEPCSPGLEALWRGAERPGPPPKDGRVLIIGSEDAPDGAVWFDPEVVEPTEFGPAGALHALLADEGAVAPLLEAAMEALRESGSRIAAITVADHEEALLAACRIAGFQHDRTDCEYVLG